MEKQKLFKIIVGVVLLTNTLVSLASTPIFTVTPPSSTLTATEGQTSTFNYTVTNNSGVALRITSEQVRNGNSAVTSDSIASNSACKTQLANGGECTLRVQVTGEAVGSSTVLPTVCAFNGMLCGQPTTPTPVTVEPLPECSGATPLCRVFLSQNLYNGSLNKNGGTGPDTNSCNDQVGLAKANCICELEAAAFTFIAPYNGTSPGHWRAWLSTTTPAVGAKDNIDYDTGGTTPTYISASNNNVTIADPGALLDGELGAAIDPDAPNPNVWTGTNGNGTLDTDNQGSCGNQWDSTGGVGGLGNSTRVNSTWTANAPAGCGSNYHIYCFEVP